jgi:hypothetical protein
MTTSTKASIGRPDVKSASVTAMPTGAIDAPFLIVLTPLTAALTFAAGFFFGLARVGFGFAGADRRTRVAGRLDAAGAGVTTCGGGDVGLGRDTGLGFGFGLGCGLGAGGAGSGSGCGVVGVVTVVGSGSCVGAADACGRGPAKGA